MFKEYIKQINKITSSSPIFYITYNTERAIGLEEILRDYHIIDGAESYTSNLLKERELLNVTIPQTKHNSFSLLKDSKVEEYLIKNSPKKPYVEFFKITKAIEHFAKVPFQILNADATISALLEDKIKQYDIFAPQLHKHLPQTVIVRLSEMNCEEVISLLGERVVLQFDRGHAGNATFFLDGVQALQNFQKDYASFDRMVKITTFIEGDPVTVNAVTTKFGTFIGGLTDQLTGLAEINAKKGESCGNNWCQSIINDEQRKGIVAITEKIGSLIYEKGFKGQFGLDFVLNGDQIFLIELNARQTTSTQIYTKLQIEQGQIPLSMIHLMEFFSMDNAIDRNLYNRENTLPLDAASIIVRNNFESNMTVTKSYNGIYDIEKVEKKDDGYSITELYSLSTMLILETNEGEIVEKDEEIFKVQVKGNIMEDKTHIDKNILKGIETILHGVIKS